MVEQPRELHITIKSGENGLQFLDIPEVKKSIPIFDFRTLAHHEMAARVLTNGGRLAMYGGVWAGISAEKRHSSGGEFFWDVKLTGAEGEIERPLEAKPPVIDAPEYGHQRIDWQQHHEKVRFLSNFGNFRRLWEGHGAYLHIIAALRPSLRSFPSRFKTTPEDYAKRYPGLTPIKFDTFAAFWREDPYLRHFSTLIKRFSHTDLFTAVTTINPHGQEPAYTFEEFLNDIRIGRCRYELFDGILADMFYEKFRNSSSPEFGPFGSHTQIRLPFADEEPTLKILRIGSLSPEGFERTTGLKCEVMPGAKDVRKVPGLNFDHLLLEMMEEIQGHYQDQKPSVRSRFQN